MEADTGEVDLPFQLEKEEASTFLSDHHRAKRGIIEECKERYFWVRGCSGEEHRESCGYNGCAVCVTVYLVN